MDSTAFPSENEILHLLAGWPVREFGKTEHAAVRDGEYELTPIELGFSGALVFRVDHITNAVPAPRHVLKGSPLSSVQERAQTIADLVATAALDCDLLAPPLLARDSACRYIDMCGYRWELAQWISGQPLAPAASADAIARGGEAIARVHWAFSEAAQKLGLVRNAAHRQTPRCILDRVHRLRQLTPRLAEAAAHNQSAEELAGQLNTQLTGERSDDAQSRFRCHELARSLLFARDLLARRWREVVPPLLGKLLAHAEDARLCARRWTLRDVHRGHVLFSECDPSRVQGILDYDAMDWDSPATDLARWSGDFFWPCSSSGDQTGAHSDSPLLAAVAGYRRVCPFPEYDFDLATTLVQVNAVGGLANWLVWLTLENRQFRGLAPRIRDRITHLIASICRIC